MYVSFSVMSHPNTSFLSSLFIPVGWEEGYCTVSGSGFTSGLPYHPTCTEFRLNYHYRGRESTVTTTCSSRPRDSLGDCVTDIITLSKSDIVSSLDDHENKVRTGGNVSFERDPHKRVLSLSFST